MRDVCVFVRARAAYALELSKVETLSAETFLNVAVVLLCYVNRMAVHWCKKRYVFHRTFLFIKLRSPTDYCEILKIILKWERLCCKFLRRSKERVYMFSLTIYWFVIILNKFTFFLFLLSPVVRTIDVRIIDVLLCMHNSIHILNFNKSDINLNHRL